MSSSDPRDLLLIVAIMLGVTLSGIVGEWAVKKNRRWLAVALTLPSYIITAAWLGICIYQFAFYLPETVIVVVRHLRDMTDQQLDLVRDSAALAILGCLAIYYASQGLLFLWERYPRFAAFFFGILFLGSSESALRYGPSNSLLGTVFYPFHILMIVISVWCFLAAFGRAPDIEKRLRLLLNIKEARA